MMVKLLPADAHNERTCTAPDLMDTGLMVTRMERA
jgi:hypothetical protein